MDIIEIRAYLVDIFRNWPVEVDSWLLLPGSEYWVGIVIFRIWVFGVFFVVGYSVGYSVGSSFFCVWVVIRKGLCG